MTRRSMSSGKDPSRWVWLVTAADQSRDATWTLAPLTNPFRSGRGRSRVVYAKWSLRGRSYYSLFAISGAEWLTVCIFFIFIICSVSVLLIRRGIFGWKEAYRWLLLCWSHSMKIWFMSDFSKHICFQSFRWVVNFFSVEIWYRCSIDQIRPP